ncbi:MAG TPA: hypothetical protein VF778_04555, partial [Xanthobacteraceae bacterium]
AMHGTGVATRLIIASSIGNALEFYEILVYGYFAVIISKVFFPAANRSASPRRSAPRRCKRSWCLSSAYGSTRSARSGS